MPTTRPTYALILAGGSGTRFWPLSRNAQPKQLLDLFGSGTLLEQTILRLDGLVPRDHIFILTNALQFEAVRQVATMLPPENIVAEPAKRDTAPAVALGIGLIAARDPEAVMIVLPSDQLIQDTASFQSVMRDAIAAADIGNALVTIGIRPTWPCPSFGYIERGAEINLTEIKAAHPVWKVARFREKPAPELAEQFLAQGNFSWNAGMFVWALPTVLKELENHSPELALFAASLSDAEDLNATIAETFPKLTPISIDYALMEHAQNVFNIEATFDWDDIGSWISIANYLPDSGRENRSNHPALTQIDASNNIIYSTSPQSHISLLGVDDLIIVQTADALLIANRHQADAIKKIVDQLPPHLI
ncbi:MAG: mannose-1-phosphate guanyltransferase [Verrucomicrobia bacterium]|nr:MAG: mannose-1-phosphate guanyltransferase [Verrucomicrobiota bacterium]